MSRVRGPKSAKTTADAFQQARKDIIATLKRIPHGKVVSYSQLAYTAGWPGRARLVARVLSDLPTSAGSVPWQRVINAQGRIAIAKDSPAHPLQQRLLEAEGVVFLNGRVSFEQHGWKTGDASPLLD